MTASIEVDTLPVSRETASSDEPCSDAPGWIARHGSSVDFLLAAELTFASVVDEAAEGPNENTAASLDTARRRMLDAAAIVASADAVPDAIAAKYLRAALRGVEAFADSDDDVAGHLSVARQILAVEGDLAATIRRLMVLRAGSAAPPRSAAGTAGQSARWNSAA